MSGPWCQAAERSPLHAGEAGSRTGPPKSRTRGRTPEQRPPIDDRNYLAERAVEAGEIPPDSFWPAQVLRLCTELKFTEKQLGDVELLLHKVLTGGRRSTLQEVDEAVRVGLTCSGELPSWLRVDMAKRVIYVRDNPHPVEDPDIVLFVRRGVVRRGA